MNDFDAGFVVGVVVTLLLVAMFACIVEGLRASREVDRVWREFYAQWNDYRERWGHHPTATTVSSGGHSHFYPWSEVKASKQGGPAPRCKFCGEARSASIESAGPGSTAADR